MNVIEKLQRKELEVSEFRRSLQLLESPPPAYVPVDASAVPTLGKLQAMLAERPDESHRAELLAKAREALAQSEAELAELRAEVQSRRDDFEQARSQLYSHAEKVREMAENFAAELLALANAGDGLNRQAKALGEAALWEDFGRFHPASSRGPVLPTVEISETLITLASASITQLIKTRSDVKR